MASALLAMIVATAALDKKKNFGESSRKHYIVDNEVNI